MHTLTCGYCNKEFQRQKRSGKANEFCSSNCAVYHGNAARREARSPRGPAIGCDDIRVRVAKNNRGNDLFERALEASAGGFEDYNIRPAARLKGRLETITGTGESSAAWPV